jgi:hypothetical protein
MLTTHSIRALYALALAEGEGVGTAYEYYVKRLVLGRWLGAWRPQRILVAGLPEKYGVSLDFLLLAADWGADVTVVDDRQPALDKLGDALQQVKTQNDSLTLAEPDCRLVSDMGSLDHLAEQRDLWVSSEVVQRLTDEMWLRYCRAALQKVERVALFAPNAENAAHTNLSGLQGLALRQLEGVVTAANENNRLNWRSGYMDMPPFPPGMARSESQRQRASTGTAERVAMWGLGSYAHLERFFPPGLRRRKAHIVYALGSVGRLRD